EDRAMTVPPLLGGRLAGGDFVLVEWTADATSSAERPLAPLHVHDRDDEAWYTLAGTLALRRVPHTYWNAGGGPARYLLVLTPRIAALIAALHEPGARGDLPGLFARFASRLVE